MLYTTVQALCGGDSSCGIDDAELDVVRCILESLADGVDFDVRDGRIHAIELRSSLV